jgi:MOB kinase activator 1
MFKFFESKLFDERKTFKAKKKVKEGTQRYTLHKFAKTLVKSGDLAKAVRLPDGADKNHWLSVHTVDFYNISNVLYGSVTEFCTPESCACMSSGPRYEYLWKDSKKYPKPTRVSAPEYVNMLMEKIEGQINHEGTFPSDDANPYPNDFGKIVCDIFRRLFRVYSHIYYSHFERIRDLQEEAHLNTAFKHFMLFAWEFDLIQPAELAPLHDLLLNMMGDVAVEKLQNVAPPAAAAAPPS